MTPKRFTPYMLITPILLFMIIVYGYPLLLTFKYSFQEVSLIGNKSTFIGLENYKTILTNSKFYNTLILTLRWTFLTVTLKIGIGFIVAVLLNGRIYFRKIYRFLIANFPNFTHSMPSDL